MSELISLEALGEQTRPPTAGRVALVALGCAKNLVDAEQMLGVLGEAGYRFVTDVAQAEVIIVNTCSFLAAAREEAIREIRAAGRQKTAGKCELLVVTGCLAQKDPALIERRCPDVDVVVGVSEFPRIAELLDEARRKQGWRPVAVSLPDLPYQEYLPRTLATPRWTAYLKIAEGCDCRCSFCTIPSIRGAFRSRPIEAVVAEAARLARDGVREVNLIAEDLTHYGQDVYGRRALADLLRGLGAVDGLHWIRLLYCYPTKVDDHLIKAMAEVPQVVPYIDMPLQHAAPGMLKAMNRGGRKEGYLRLIGKLRSAMPEICIRSTFIVGFPGEHVAEVEELAEFLDAAQLDRVGFFAYSPEPGTSAAELPGQVPHSVAEARIAALAERQAAISAARLQALVGRRIEVLVEECGEGWSSGRSYRDAPEIDGLVRLAGEAEPGSLVTAEVVEAGTHDMLARLDLG